jgi:hypothetical protein
MLDPAKFSVIETLRNEREIEIRAQRPQDRKDGYSPYDIIPRQLFFVAFANDATRRFQNK